MFDRISDYLITVWHKEPKGVSALHDSQALFAMKRIGRMLTWHHDELLQDAAKNTHLADMDKQDGELFEKYHNDFNEFSMRNGARTLSYIVLVGLLEGITKQFYNKLIDTGNSVFGLGEKPDEEAMKHRKAEFSLARSYRNKLAAHTAYGHPYDADTQSQLLTSVFHAQAHGSYSAEDISTFQLGGTQLKVGTADPDTIFSKPYGLKDQHPKMINHFSLWEEMILIPLRKFESKCPFENAHLKIVSRTVRT